MPRRVALAHSGTTQLEEKGKYTLPATTSLDKGLQRKRTKMLQENSVAVLLQEAKRIAHSKGLQKLPLPSVAFLSRYFLCDEHLVYIRL